jgi:hypothetical protein
MGEGATHPNSLVPPATPHVPHAPHMPTTPNASGSLVTPMPKPDQGFGASE